MDSRKKPQLMIASTVFAMIAMRVCLKETKYLTLFL